MEKEQLIKQAKQFRKDADELLQRMKDHEEIFFKELPTNPCCCDNAHEAIAQHIISIRDLEAILAEKGLDKRPEA